MAAAGISPGVIATIVVILLVAAILILFYFVCRSDDPAKDHTCVAMLYPHSRRELRQLRIPLDPINSTNEHVNTGYVDEKVEETQQTTHHEVQIHNAATQSEEKMKTTTTNAELPNEGPSSPDGFITLSIHSQPTSQ